ncbi:MAG: site-2 protease family protein [Thermoplasmata archaeon]
MADLQSILIAILVIGVYSLAVLVLWKLKYLEKYNFVPWAGPILMWKTQRGKAVLDKLAKHRRCCELYGNISIAITVISMFFITGLLLWSVSKVSLIPKEKAPSPELLLGIPGINPVIPVFYGIIALVIAIVFHELAHGVLSRAGNITVNSMGIIFFIFPIGAFVEPDEEQLLKTERMKRSRVVAVGPATNMFIALISLLIFSLVFAPCIQPKAEGIGIVGVEKDAPASHTSLQPYDILLSINGTRVKDYSEFKKALNSTMPGQTVEIEFYSKSSGKVLKENLTLGNKYDYIPSEENRNKSYIGISMLPLDLTGFKNELENPFHDGIGSFLTFISLPFLGLSPIDERIGSFYTINAPIEPGLFFILFNIFYWVFWINLMVALTNALPSLPLDAGYLVRDGIFILLSRTKMKDEKKEKVVKNAMICIGLVVLFLILFQIIGPRVFGV